MEAAAGKNPVSHVGKLYNVLAARIAAGVVRDVSGVRGAACMLVSQIGRPVNEPQVIDIELVLADAVHTEDVRPSVERQVRDQLANMRELCAEIVRGQVPLY